MTTNELDRALQNSVNRREAVKEREFAEEKARRDAEVNARFGTTDMCKQELKKVVDSDRRMYYRTEELNDKLYIHYKGWREINGLEGWTGLKALYAECNAFSRIQGLQNCRMLRSLFLSENCITKIEGLENCPELWSLNLSNNFIERLEGISHLNSLNTLIIAKNKIGFGGVDDVAEILDMNLSTLDIQDNKISDPDVVPEVFARMKDFRVLYLKGNPCGKKIPNYRKGITAVCENLKYLDDRPVFPEDRRAAEAFNRGGLEEERAERKRIRDENNNAHDRNMKAFQEMIERSKSESREKKAMRAEDKYTDDTDPVESQERRMKRQMDAWKEDNKEELRDKDKEWAERCLKNEREGKGGNAEKAKSAELPSEDTEDAPVIDEDESSTEEAPPPIGGDKEKVDNRKLVYEDIWDDLPGPTKGAANATAIATGAASVAGAIAGAAGAAAALGGWTAEAKRPAFAPPPRSGAVPEAGRAPDWHAKFAQIGGKKGPDAAAPVAPTPQPAAQVSTGAELDEMD